MPNHVHLIVRLTSVVAPLGGALDTSGASPAGPTVRAPKTSDVIGAFKSIVAVEWTRRLKKEARIAEGRVWQPNFYERIVRGDAELARVREYIVANPAMWARDRDNPHRQAASEYDSLWQWLEESLTDLR